MTRKPVQGFEDAVTAQVPLKRMGTSEEVAAAALFLAADASFVTGTELIAGCGLVDV